VTNLYAIASFSNELYVTPYVALLDLKYSDADNGMKI